MRLTETQLEDLFWEATVLTLGLDPQAESSQSFVRRSWPEADTGNGSWQRDEDVIFLRVSPNMDSYSSLFDTQYGDDPKTGEYQETVLYHRAFQVQWICYGPHACDNADLIRVGMQRQNVRGKLLKSEIAVIPNVTDPIRAPELDSAGQVWERCDLNIRFYAVTTSTMPVDAITVPPDIHFSNS